MYAIKMGHTRSSRQTVVVEYSLIVIQLSNDEMMIVNIGASLFVFIIIQCEKKPFPYLLSECSSLYI